MPRIRSSWRFSLMSVRLVMMSSLMYLMIIWPLLRSRAAYSPNPIVYSLNMVNARLTASGSSSSVCGHTWRCSPSATPCLTDSRGPWWWRDTSGTALLWSCSMTNSGLMSASAKLQKFLHRASSRTYLPRINLDSYGLFSYGTYKPNIDIDIE